MQEPTLSELYRAIQTHTRESETHRQEMRSLLEKQGEKLDKIEVQTTRTNGRVLALEKKADDVDSDIKENTRKTTEIDRRMWIAIGGGTVVMIIGALLARLYVEDISRQTATGIIAGLENKYDIEIR